MYINNYTIIYIYIHMYVWSSNKPWSWLNKKTEASFPIRCFGFADFRASHHRLQDRRRMAERCKILCAADRDQWLKKLQTYSVWCVQFTWRKILKWRINVHLTLWTVFLWTFTWTSPEMSIFPGHHWNPSRWPCSWETQSLNRYLIFRQSHMS